MKKITGKETPEERKERIQKIFKYLVKKHHKVLERLAKE
jgi:hypothetical protein